MSYVTARSSQARDSYIVIAGNFGDGGSFDDRFINTFHQDPVASRNTVHLNTVSGKKDNDTSHNQYRLLQHLLQDVDGRA